MASGTFTTIASPVGKVAVVLNVISNVSNKFLDQLSINLNGISTVSSPGSGNYNCDRRNGCYRKPSF